MMNQQQQQQLQQQQQVRQAAIALHRPATDGATRWAASQFLEHWNATPEAWEWYCQWLERAFLQGEDDDDDHDNGVAVPLLLLQLLQTKIRREIRFHCDQQAEGSHHPHSNSNTNKHNAVPPLLLLDRLQAALQHCLLQSSPQQQWPESTVVQPLCLCIAALMVRRPGQLAQAVPALCRSIVHHEYNNNVAATAGSNDNTAGGQAQQRQLRILCSIPLELQSGVSGLAPSQVTQTLAPHVASVLELLLYTIQASLTNGGSSNNHQTLLYALTATKNWIQEGRVTLSQLHAVVGNGNNGSSSLLLCLVQLLSHAAAAAATWVPDDAILVQAAHSLQEAILVAADACTETRTAAVAVLLQAFEPTVGFLSAPLSECCGEEAAVALASLASTFAVEEIDALIEQPCDSLLRFLLACQTHPVVAVRTAMLDCWLTVSEVSVNERHGHWRAPLFQQITAALLQTVEYCDEVDEDDLLDFRRMAGDIFVACYFLLRCEYVQHATRIVVCGTTHQQHQHQPAKAEAALFALTAAAREINARIKSRTGGTSVGKDRQTTAELLLQVVQHLMNSNGSTDRLVKVGAVKFIGSFATTWSVRCSADDVLHLLAYLQNALLQSGRKALSSSAADDEEESFAEETSKAIKSILVNASTTLLQTSNPNAVLDCCRGMMDAALSTHREECMAVVAEGCTRLVAQTKDSSTIGHFLNELVRPVLQKGEGALNMLPSNHDATQTPLSEQAIESMESLGSILRVLQEIIRFSDGLTDTSANASHPVASIMGFVFPFLEAVSQRASHFELIFEKIMGIQEQLLKTVPNEIAPYFQQTVKYVIEVFDSSQNPACMQYLASSVEAFGSTSVEAFRDLLSHVSGIVFARLHQHGPEPNSALIQGFFGMCHRYFIYCPAALVGCPQFAGIVSCAVELLALAKGDRESVRAALNFLTQVFGWRALRLSVEASRYLHSVAHALDEQLSQHGARTAHCCMATLLGGSQALWPVCTDCLFAIASTAVTWTVPENSASSVAYQWMDAAWSNTAGSVEPEVIRTLVGVLLIFASDGPKSKSRAKLLLTDFCMVARGERLAVDVLDEYTL